MWNIILPRITIFQSQTKVQKQVKMCPQGYSSIFPDLKFSNTSSVYLIRYFVSTYRPDACSTGNIYLTSSLQLHSNVTRCTKRVSHDFEVICRYILPTFTLSLYNWALKAIFSIWPRTEMVIKLKRGFSAVTVSVASFSCTVAVQSVRCRVSQCRHRYSDAVTVKTEVLRNASVRGLLGPHQLWLFEAAVVLKGA